MLIASPCFGTIFSQLNGLPVNISSILLFLFLNLVWRIFNCGLDLVLLTASLAGSDCLSFCFWGIIIGSQFVPACDAFIAAVLTAMLMLIMKGLWGESIVVQRGVFKMTPESFEDTKKYWTLQYTAEDGQRWDHLESHEVGDGLLCSGCFIEFTSPLWDKLKLFRKLFLASQWIQFQLVCAWKLMLQACSFCDVCTGQDLPTIYVDQCNMRQSEARFCSFA